MPIWDSQQYLKFADKRTRPAAELAARVGLEAPARVVDLGCGPGNSTAVLAGRWPGAQITGVDSSAEMLVEARAALPAVEFVQADIADTAAWTGANYGGAGFDLIYSNAALQWVPGHAALLPRLMGLLEPGGALAFQAPANMNAPAHQAMRDVGALPEFRGYFTAAPREWATLAPEAYYDILAPHAAQVDLWTTEYCHVMESHAAIVEWYRGSGLRPWLQALPSEAARGKFTAAFFRQIEAAFPQRSNGRVLFPFLRLFAIAYRV